jgi:hypothetical protein
MLRNIEEEVRHWQLPGHEPDADGEWLRLAAMTSYMKAEGIMYLWMVQGLEFDREMVTKLLAEQSYTTFYKE